MNSIANIAETPQFVHIGQPWRKRCDVGIHTFTSTDIILCSRDDVDTNEQVSTFTRRRRLKYCWPEKCFFIRKYKRVPLGM